MIKEVGGDAYISGPSAKSYINEQVFDDENIRLVWKDYSGYPVYNQQLSNFEHSVSIFDMLFCLGPETPDYIWGWRAKTKK